MSALRLTLITQDGRRRRRRAPEVAELQVVRAEGRRAEVGRAEARADGRRLERSLIRL